MPTSDESALIALSLEYADAVRARDVERWAATWTEDARWVLGPDREVAGREAIVELWRTSIGDPQATRTEERTHWEPVEVPEGAVMGGAALGGAA